MAVGKSFADFLIKSCGLRHLHGGKISWALRNVLLEIDLQHFRDTHPCHSCIRREQMYSYVHESVINEEPIDYLEFGVYQGDTVRYWASLNKIRSSRFFGFDSFEGLPEQWCRTDKGFFSTSGAEPQIDDERVKFIKGWFNETVPPFARGFSVKNRLVMHLDADLYSSTMIALALLGPVMPKGTLLFFDEFFSRDDEFRALMDWQSMYGRKFRVVAEVGNFGKICAELL
jgi:hypothetical protein